ncbi:MAG: hypothetical protein NTW95_12620 [Candidatus Aminicenantes bacterium]|nr:hypothetical protein [Candidatus Aminicenantes bacterium]
MKKKLFAALWLACLALVTPSAGTLRAAKYPPGLRWREVARGSFTIIFPAERAAEAEAALAAAEGLNEKLASFWRFRPLGRVRLVLSDSTDQPNGFATYFPFNLVEADLPESPPDSELAVSRGWLDLVLAHELTHVFTLNAGSDLFRIAHGIFGNLPLLYSATQLPPWVIEGLAVEGESRLTGDGRLNHSPYRMMLDAARRDGLFPSWSRIAGMPAAWPGATSKYLFGAGFMEFLAEKYGVDSLRKYLERVADQLILFGSSRDFKRTFGGPLGKLWTEYRDHSPATTVPAPRPLTASGFLHQYPCLLGNDRLAYYHRDYRSRGAVEILELWGGREKVLFAMDAVNGLSFSEKENKIYLSAVDYFHAFSDFSDLYEYDMKKGRLKRLSRGGRLSQPAKKENSDEIFCIQRRDGRYYLADFDTRRQTSRTLSCGFAGLSQISLSPNQSLLAAAVKPEGGPWGIGLFSPSGELSLFITAPGANLSQPRWQGDRQLFFILVEKDTSRLASISLDGNGGRTCVDPRLSALQQFTFSNDGREVFFTCFSGRGIELSRLGLDGLAFSPLGLTVAQEARDTKPGPIPASSRPYRFWRDLLPKWWSPAWRTSGDEIQAGALTSGQDALGIHSYSSEGYYGFSSHRANLLFQYVYDGLFPTLTFAYKDSVGYYRGSRNSLRTQELKLASLWPLRIRRRSQLYGYADVHLERRSHIDGWNTFTYTGSFNGLRLGLEFNSSRDYYDSISPADGVLVTWQGSVHPAGLGNEFTCRSAQLDLRQYIPLFRPGVLAWRLAMARSWDASNHYYDMGGREAETGLGGSQPFHLMRGFPAGYQWGDRGWLFNLEYRLPLFKIEKAVLPAVSLDRVYLSTFFDMGRLGSGSSAFPTAYSVGTEAVLRLAFGGAAAYDFCLGAACGFGPERQYQFYLRMGRSF